MRKGIKTAAALLMLAAATILLNGCHRKIVGGDVVPVPSVLDETRPIQLTFWSKNDTNETQKAVYAKAIEDFRKLYPNIQINNVPYADYNEIFNGVMNNMRTQAFPNICVTYPDHIATYMADESRPVLQMDDWMQDSRYGLGGSELRFDGPEETEIVPEFLGEGILNGHYYAMPFMRSTEALYINQDMVEKLGYELPDVVTWDFMWEVSEKAMEKNADGTFKINGKIKMIPVIYKSTDNMMITMLKQKNAPYSTESGEVQIFNNTTKDLLRMVYDHARTRAFSTFKKSSYPGNSLNREECIFAIDSTAGATWMGGDAPLQDIPEEQRVSFRLAVRPVPQFSEDNIRMISQGPSVCIFKREGQDPQEILASWLFVQYLMSDEVQMSYAQTEGYLPVTLKAQRNEAYQDYLSRKGEDNNLHYRTKIEATELLMNHMSDTFVTPVFDGSTLLRQAAGYLIEETRDRGSRGKEFDDAAIEGMFRDANELYGLSGIRVQQEKTDEPAEPEDSGTAPETAGAAEGKTGGGGDGDGTEVMSMQDIGSGGELPPASKALLIAIPSVWLLLGLYTLWEKKKTKRKN